DTWHKTSGRIYRLGPKTGDKPIQSFDISSYSNEELVQLLSHENKWFRQEALRQFGDRKDPSSLPLLVKLLQTGNEQEVLEALWAINLTAGINDEIGKMGLNHKDPFVRMWTVRLLGDKQSLSPAMFQELQKLATKESHPEVRSQLMASAKRLPSTQTFSLIENLLNNHEDSEDPDIPLLTWWALEEKATSDREGVLAMMADDKIWQHPIMEKVLLGRLMQRYIMEGGEENFAMATQLLEEAPSPKHVKILIEGLQEGLLGREMVTLPDNLLKILEKNNKELGDSPLTLALRRREEKALAEALKIINDPNAEIGLRLSYIQVLGEINQDEVVPDLLNLVKNGQSSPVIKQTALHALQSYNQKEIGEQLSKAYPGFRDNVYVREAAISLFASRKEWAMDFFNEIEQPKTISPDDVEYHFARRFRLLQDEQINERADRIWPSSKLLTSEEKTKRINAYGKLIGKGEQNVKKGRTLFLSNCGSCHQLNGEGGLSGPELTGYDRSNPDYLLLHIVDPNADIREGYEVQRIVTTDGRILEGRLKSQSGGTITIEPPLGGKSTVLSQDRIAAMEVQQTTYMPERILEPLSDEEVSDLFAYLMQVK
ncbi:MAG: c-type cytochrome, partial [Eudoraea sp.]|nr:c-type cytochrome [Eudoraea sp.]